MFFANPLRFPPGTVLVVPLSPYVRLNLKDFINLESRDTGYEIWWNFGGDNTIYQHGNSSTGNEGTDPRVPTTPAPCFDILADFSQFAVFTLRMTVNIAGGIWERYQWEIQVALKASDLHQGSDLEYLAATHATFELPGGPRQVIVPLPKWSSDGYGSSSGSSGSGSGDADPAGVFGAGLEKFTRQFQQAYALGFGRLAVPAEPQTRGVHVHMLAETAVYGTDSALLEDLTTLELRMREALLNSNQPDALSAIRKNLDNLYDLPPDLAKLSRINLVGGDVLVPGKRTIRLIDVIDWRAFSISALNEGKRFGGSDSQTGVSLADWRKFEGAFDRELPEFDHAAAWRWEVVQSISQAVGAMYQGFSEAGASAGPGGPWDPNDARILFTAIPGSDTVTLRVYDVVQRFWAQVTLATSGPDGHIELNQMEDLATDLNLPGSGYVAARSAGVINIGSANNDVPHIFNVHHVEDALDGTLFALVPSIQELPESVRPFREVAGTEAGKRLGPDGTAYVVAKSNDAVVATIGAPAVQMPDGKDVWSSLRPHALFVTLGGAMTPVKRRPG